jgi:pimeloyl-ACP methyl ester carboxylesterase
MKVGDIYSPAFARVATEEQGGPPKYDLCQKCQKSTSSSRVLTLAITMNVFLLFLSESTFGQVSVQESIKIGGIQQWIQIKGVRSENPVLLFLHGGPGNSAMSYARKFTAELQKHFVVVQWDQRGSGKTLQLNPLSQPLSLAMIESDVLEMTNYLRARFSRQKIYLMGHSWGGFLALQAAAHHPELFVACLAVSPMVNQLESENLSLAWMQEMAIENKNTLAVEELEKVKIPFQDGQHIYYHRNWLAHFAGNKPLSKSYVVSWAAKWLPLFSEASAVNFTLTAPEIRCPVYFFVGRHDYQTHFKLTEDYFKMLKAEKKELFWFTNSGHNLNLTEPKKLQEIIIQLHKNNLTEYP